jgi:hypothetical protein
VKRPKNVAKEGRVFAIPLEHTGFGIGVVARASRSGVTLGYFYGDTFGTAQDAAKRIPFLRAKGSILVALFGDLGIRRGKWPLIGAITPWSPELWPVPKFRRVDAMGEKAWIVERDPSNVSRTASETEINVADCQELPDEALYGYQAMEMRLSDAINGSHGRLLS